MTTRYRAFISYSHADRAVVAWLHRALETYRLPRKLVGRATPLGPVPARLGPVFRDRDELRASGDLNEELRGALRDSLFLVVVCTPAAARSRWVNEEVLTFKRLHGEARVLALIVDGEPGGGGDQPECFVPALRRRLRADGELGEDEASPVAADMREHADGRRLALTKLIAGLAGVALDDLVRRETQRRVRRLTAVAIAAVAATAFTGALALYANARRIDANEQRRVAERESATATAASDFLVSTFGLANPATDNPRTITALTILERGATRARTELAAQPLVQLRLLGTVARAYNNLGLLREARAALEPSLEQLRRAGPDGAATLLVLGQTELLQGNLPQAEATARAAIAQLGADRTRYPETRAAGAELVARIDAAAIRLPRALAEYDEALAYYRGLPTPRPEDVARVLNNRGLLLSDMGRLAEAQASLSEANALWRRALGEHHLVVGQSYLALAQNAQFAGALPEAERDAAQGLAILRAVLEPDNPLIGDALSLQGQILLGAGRLAEARAALAAAVDVDRRAYRGPHYAIGIAEVYLAMIDSRSGDTAGALAELDDAKRQYDASYGQLHANHGDLLVNRALVLKRAHRLAEASRDCAAGLEILRQTSGADSAFYRQNVELCRGL
ncbi:MAG: toll/interleukin-1 receptor domain-containing protein [Proteobacteria bacterium]|nr:toll/interleukin-1 receptor domain-containing protein [Pseudomonadota bacterium]